MKNLAIGLLLLSVKICAQPAPVELLFKMPLENTTRLPVVAGVVTDPNLELQTYGDGKNIVVAVGNGANFPRTFFGLCAPHLGQST